MRSSSGTLIRLLVYVYVIIISVLFIAVVVVGGDSSSSSSSMWCVARSDASDAELQRGMDYACAAGADCTPILENGLCYLPNTLQAHASYAFNSFFQRSFMAPSSCDFSHTASLAKTDPSYGSCVYPQSLRRDNSTIPTTNPNVIFGSGSGSAFPMTPPTSTSSAGAGAGAGTGTETGSGTGTGTGTGGVYNMGPPIPTTTNSKAPSKSVSNSMALSTAITLLLLPLLCVGRPWNICRLFLPL